MAMRITRSGPLPLFWCHFCSTREAALRAERFRGNVRPYQSVSELTVSAASALSDYYATHAQLIQSDTHAPFEMLENVIDRCRFATLKSFQKNVVNRHLAHPSRWWRFHNRAAERS